MKDLFCANCQLVTTQEATVDGNGEFVFTCPCGRFIKFPGDVDAAQLTTLIADHEEANKGQVSLEAQFNVLDEIVADTTAESQSNDANNLPA